MTVASTGSISAAAEILHIAQPALSIQIKNLEDQLGFILFYRHARGVKLTAVGDRFLLHCVEILKRVDLAYADIRTATEDPSGTVAVGLPQSIAKFVAVPLVRQTINMYPKIKLQMIECVFHSNWTPDPRQTDQSFHCKLDSKSSANWSPRSVATRG